MEKNRQNVIICREKNDVSFLTAVLMDEFKIARTPADGELRNFTE